MFPVSFLVLDFNTRYILMISVFEIKKNTKKQTRISFFCFVLFLRFHFITHNILLDNTEI